jgi:hypothetical protein
MSNADGDIYAHAFTAHGGQEYEGAVRVFRRAAAAADGKITVAAVGPLKNIANFLKSAPDDVAPYDGIELFRRKVGRLCIMGGCFKENTYYENVPIDTEYNIVQDIDSAVYVSENCPSEIVYSPFELGNKIFTGGNLKPGSPAVLCYKTYFGRWGSTRTERESWDPVTVYYAVLGENGLLKKSARGRVSFTKEGKSVFEKGGTARHFYLENRAGCETIATELNKYMV